MQSGIYIKTVKSTDNNNDTAYLTKNLYTTYKRQKKITTTLCMSPLASSLWSDTPLIYQKEELYYILFLRTFEGSKPIIIIGQSMKFFLSSLGESEKEYYLSRRSRRRNIFLSLYSSIKISILLFPIVIILS